MNAVDIDLPERGIERSWRNRMVSLLRNGGGMTGELFPRFPAVLPADLRVRFKRVCFRADWCVLSLHIEHEQPTALMPSVTCALSALGWPISTTEDGVIRAEPPRASGTVQLEFEELSDGLSVAWWLDEEQMNWIVNAARSISDGTQIEQNVRERAQQQIVRERAQQQIVRERAQQQIVRERAQQQIEPIGQQLLH